MSTRTDSHSPKNLVTEDYNYVAVLDLHPDDKPTPAMVAYRRRMMDLLISSPAVRNIGQCDHCGARIRYTAILRHLPTGEHIHVGETCLDNRFERSTADFQAMRKQAELDRAEHRIKTAVAAFVAANPDLAFMTSWETTREASTNDFVIDVAGKLRKYGELSERQVAAVRAALVRDAEWAAKKAVVQAAKDAAEAANPAQPVPTGRIVLTGEVLTTKYVDSQFGSTLKMLVKEDRGFKVWGTVPNSLDVERGDRVAFTATVEPSKDDATFGFFTRPSKASAVTAREID